MSIPAPQLKVVERVDGRKTGSSPYRHLKDVNVHITLQSLGPGEKLQLHDGSETSVDDFVKDPESLCSTLIWEDEADRVTWVYR